MEWKTLHPVEPIFRKTNEPFTERIVFKRNPRINYSPDCLLVPSLRELETGQPDSDVIQMLRSRAKANHQQASINQGSTVSSTSVKSFGGFDAARDVSTQVRRFSVTEGDPSITMKESDPNDCLQGTVSLDSSIELIREALNHPTSEMRRACLRQARETIMERTKDELNRSRELDQGNSMLVQHSGLEPRNESSILAIAPVAQQSFDFGTPDVADIRRNEVFQSSPLEDRGSPVKDQAIQTDVLDGSTMVEELQQSSSSASGRSMMGLQFKSRPEKDFLSLL